MERKNRPLSREKKISEGSAHVGRREQTGGSRPAGTESSPGSGRNSGGGSSGGGRSSRRSPLLIILLLIGALIFGGKESLVPLLSGGMEGTSPPSHLESGNGAHGLGGGSNFMGDTATGVLNTSVSDDARPKRTVLKGNGADRTTIMIYMCGTDLESGGGFATSDLQEMMSADIGSQLHVLVFTGGCKQWKNQIVQSSKNQIYQVTSGGLTLLTETSQLQPMTDPATLSSFIRWSKANYPADRYALIFWDHGGGSVSGYGYDEVYARSGSMTLDKIGSALKDGGCTFDFIGFDACLMATLETALVAEPYADYLIASEETEPGCGWYYTNWLTSLSSNPSMPALQIGKKIADDFVTVCGRSAPRQQATLSVIDLAELAGTIPDPFRSFSQSTAQLIQEDHYQTVASARTQTKEFAESSGIDQVDLIHLAKNMDTDESMELAAALESAVKYNLTSSNIQNAYGISIYFPYGRMEHVSKMADTYSKIGLDQSYTDCIRRFASVEVAGQTVAGGQTSELQSLFGALLSGGNAYTGASINSSDVVGQLLEGLLQGNARSLAEVGLNGGEAAFLEEQLLKDSKDYLTDHQLDPSALVWTEKKGQKVLALEEEQWELVQDAELNVFVDDGSGYIDLGLDNVFSFNDDGDLIGDYDQTWLAVNGQIVAYYMLSSEGTSEDYKILGRIPALLNQQRVNLIVSFTDEYPDGEILGASICYDEETQTQTIARGLLELQEGDTIDFLCDYYDYDRNYQDAYYLGDPLTVTGKLELSNIKMDRTGYIASYRLTDIYHNHYWTPSIS